jgi:Tfp pilus assembly protein PilO
MKISSQWARWKVGAAIGVGLIVLADVALCVALWQMGRDSTVQMTIRRNQLIHTVQELRSDVAHGREIQKSMPEIGRQCDDFYKTAFLDYSTMYSTVDSDIADLASKSGVRITGHNFKSKPVPNRSASELDINMSVEGTYPALLKFVNGIERSKDFYFLNQLQLAEGAANGIRLQLELHTYFRT